MTHQETDLIAKIDAFFTEAGVDPTDSSGPITDVAAKMLSGAWLPSNSNSSCPHQSIRPRDRMCHQSVQQTLRRQMNRAIFEEILVDVDGTVVYARMAQPFAAFHDVEFRTCFAESATNPGPQQVRGSNIDTLVGAEGLEPSTTGL